MAADTDLRDTENAEWMLQILQRWGAGMHGLEAVSKELGCIQGIAYRAAFKLLEHRRIRIWKCTEKFGPEADEIDTTIYLELIPGID
jgi:hypothetical protein